MQATAFENPAQWARHGDAWARGSAFRDGHLLADASLAARADACRSAEELAGLAAGLNGHYALLVSRGDSLYLACDRMRSIPLLYTMSGRAAAGDSVEQLLDACGSRERDPVSVEEFYLAGFVTGPHTLYSHVRQVRPGEAVELARTPGGLAATQHRYYQFRQRDELPADIEALLPIYRQAVQASVGRLVDFAAGRQIAVPTSAGYDSRVLALTLAELGYPNVVLFSYGTEGSPEARVGREVAEQSGMRWLPVLYGPAEWADWLRSPQWARFRDGANYGASLPCLQDWPALWHLTREGLVDADAVVAPGYSAELGAGSSTPEVRRVRMPWPRRYAAGVIEAHYRLWRWGAEQRRCRREIERRILDSVGGLGGYASWPSAAYAFDMNERQAKFIANATRSIEFWGLSWWLPWYDREFLDFWEVAPTSCRVARALAYAYGDDLAQRVCKSAENLRAAGKTYASDTPRAPRDPMRRLRAAAGRVAHLRPIARLRHERAERYARYLYHHDPYGWYGVVSEQDLVRHWVNGAKDINSLLAAEMLGRLSLGAMPEPSERRALSEDHRHV